MNISIEFKRNTFFSVQIPLDLIIKITSQPDMEKVHEIIEKQKEINRSHKPYDRKKPSFVPLEQQSFFKIQQALFPGFILMQSCKAYADPVLKKTVAGESKKILYKIFPQGIALYLLPEPARNRVLAHSAMKEKMRINALLKCCYQQNPIDQNFIKTTLLTPNLLKSITTSPEFENLLKKYSLTHTYHNTLKQHTLYDKSNTVIIVCSEEKHFSFSSQFFKVAVPNIKEYKPLYDNLIELCMKNITLSSAINNIAYHISDNELQSFTSTERILLHLATSIKSVKKDLYHQGNLNILMLKMVFGNFFRVLDFLCSLDEIDLSLPAVSYKGNIAQKIVHEFKTNGYPLDIFSQKAQENINFCSQVNSNNKPLNEKQEVINALVNIFLSNFPLENKEEMRPFLEKSRQQRDELNKKVILFHKVEDIVGIPVIAKTITSLLWRFYK
jgi:hypothetical protein